MESPMEVSIESSFNPFDELTDISNQSTSDSVVCGVVTSEQDHETAKRMSKDSKENDFQVFYLLRELIESEHVYINALQKVKHHYIDAIEASKPLVIEAGTKLKVFGNIEEILTLNQRLINDIEHNLFTLEVNKSKWTNGNQPDIKDISELRLKFALAIADALKRLLPLFKEPYSTYAKSLSNSLKILSETSEKSETFSKFLEDRKFGSNGLQLNALLIQPIQRICRYTLFLSGIVKQTDEKHESYSLLVDAKTMADNLAQTADKEKAEAEKKIRHIEVAEQLRGLEEFDTDGGLTKKGREYICEWKCTLTEEKSSNNKNSYTFFLFSDVLVIAYIRNTMKDVYWVTEWLSLKELVTKKERGKNECKLEILHVYERTSDGVDSSKGLKTLSRFLTSSSSTFRPNEDFVSKRTIVDTYCLEFASPGECIHVASEIENAKSNLKPVSNNVCKIPTKSKQKHMISIKPKDESINYVSPSGFNLAPPSRDRAETYHLSLRRPPISQKSRIRRKSLPASQLESRKDKQPLIQSVTEDDTEDLRKQLDIVFGIPA